MGADEHRWVAAGSAAHTIIRAYPSVPFCGVFNRKRNGWIQWAVREKFIA